MHKRAPARDMQSVKSVNLVWCFTGPVVVFSNGSLPCGRGTAWCVPGQGGNQVDNFPDPGSALPLSHKINAPDGLALISLAASKSLAAYDGASFGQGTKVVRRSVVCLTQLLGAVFRRRPGSTGQQRSMSAHLQSQRETLGL